NIFRRGATAVQWKSWFGRRKSADDSPFSVFLAPGAEAINRARQQHLASLGLDLAGKNVLEVGAGIGLHTPFFLERGCDVTVTDGRSASLAGSTSSTATVCSITSAIRNARLRALPRSATACCCSRRRCRREAM